VHSGLCCGLLQTHFTVNYFVIRLCWTWNLARVLLI